MGSDLEDPSLKLEQFIDLFLSFGAEGFEIFRTELSVYSAELDVAGQIDGLFVDAEGNFVVVDWKRSARITFDCNRQMRPPIEHLPDCNGSHYSLQLNLYRLMLESVGFQVRRMFICAFHPLSQARVIEVPRLDVELGLIAAWARDASRRVCECFGGCHGCEAKDREKVPAGVGEAVGQATS